MLTTTKVNLKDNNNCPKARLFDKNALVDAWVVVGSTRHYGVVAFVIKTIYDFCRNRLRYNFVQLGVFWQPLNTR
jgi:hypothetical protein